MIIPCYRCDKKIDTPNNHNADYILLADGEKTAIICPSCFDPDDVLIWGVHREQPNVKRRSVWQVVKDLVKKVIR